MATVFTESGKIQTAQSISTIPKQLQLNIYKFLEFNSIDSLMLVSKGVHTSLNSEALWIFLVKRDLTEKTLETGESYKSFYLAAMPFLCSIDSCATSLKKMEEYRNKKWSEISDADKDEYYSFGMECENRFEILHEAASKGYDKCLVIILNNLDIKVDECNSEIGTTAICMAAQYNNILCVEKLLSLGSDLENIDEFGASPLCYAVIGGSLESVKFLLNKGAKVTNVHTREVEMLNDLEKCEPKIKKEIMDLLKNQVNTITQNKTDSTNQESLKKLQESLLNYEKIYQKTIQETSQQKTMLLKKLQEEKMNQTLEGSITNSEADLLKKGSSFTKEFKQHS